MAQMFEKNSSLTEVHGYTPLAKRIAVLQVSGMRTMMAKDELYDNINDLVRDRSGRIIGEKLVISPPPPLPRHVDADYADVADQFDQYRERRRLIRLKQREIQEKAKQGVQGPPPVNPEEASPKPPKPPQGEK